MGTYWATFCKDLLLLRRDRVGLLVLFVMPVLLVLLISLIQNNILTVSGEQGMALLLVDQDHGELGKLVRSQLGERGEFKLSEANDPVAARRAVAAGDYQFGILIPAGTDAVLQTRGEHLASEALSGLQADFEEQPLQVELFFDPTAQGAFRLAVASSLRQILFAREVQVKAAALGAALDPTGASTGFGELLSEHSLLQLRQVNAAGDTKSLRPNAVQQNVPAWSLFGMFFIVVPLSGALIRERQQGTLQRLHTLPISPVALLAGKLSAYALICLIQFGLMLLVGRFLLPLLGTPTLQLAGHLPAALLLAGAAALAATGYGLLIGVWARSYEQASMFGAVSVVIAAALGGVMVPVYLMPSGMQLVSRLSPLGWGLQGFMEIFVRGGGLAAVVPQLSRLLLLFVVLLLVSWLGFRRRNRV